MKLEDLVKPIDQLTDEELLERLRGIRNNRMVLRPAAKAHSDRAEKKETRKKVDKVTDMFANLSAADKEALIKQLSEGSGEGNT